MKNCLCIICYKPNLAWIEFLQNFNKYDVYLIIDDNDNTYHNEKINIIQIPDEKCDKNGFKNINFMIRKKITGWEKAIYYFSTINLNYDNIWFIEDDVFFYNENTLLNIDLKYPNADLLSKQYTVNINGNKKYWHWRSINIPFAPPYYSAMVCACRMSKKLLSKIKEYTNVHRTMFFLEAMFPTICKRTGLVYHTPEELNGIVWRKKYTATDLDVKGLFHPIKNKQQHTMYRNLIRLIS